MFLQKSKKNSFREQRQKAAPSPSSTLKSCKLQIATCEKKDDVCVSFWINYQQEFSVYEYEGVLRRGCWDAATRTFVNTKPNKEVRKNLITDGKYRYVEMDETYETYSIILGCETDLCNDENLCYPLQVLEWNIKLIAT